MQRPPAHFTARQQGPLFHVQPEQREAGSLSRSRTEGFVVLLCEKQVIKDVSTAALETNAKASLKKLTQIGKKEATPSACRASLSR